MVPALRTSADGRVALDVRRFDGDVGFFLLKPEALTSSFLFGQPGAASIVDAASPYLVSPSAFFDKSLGGSLKHHTICDRTSQWAAGQVPTTPTGDNFGGDRYDLTIISSVAMTPEIIRLWSTEITVEVANAKTANAYISNIETNPPTMGPEFGFYDFVEPMITSDGRLLVARIGNTPYVWTNPNTQQPLDQVTDIVYSVYSEDRDPCDVNGWTNFHPISHAPYDPQMIPRYGIAKYPFRDSTGALIPDGVDIRGTYPWIDRKGANLFFEAVGTTLYYDDNGTIRERYPSRCVDSYQCYAPQDIGEIKNTESIAIATRGISFVGLWSRGKMVLLDAVFNNIDYGLGRSGAEHRMLQLYKPLTDASVQHDGWVRAGTGRDNGFDDGSAPALSTSNTAVIDSLENLFNYRGNMAPLTVRDVVWLVNTGKASAEVAFDDYLDPNGFIVADMSAALTFESGRARLMYHDGFDQPTKNTGHGFTLTPRIQNAATATLDTWRVPSHGRVNGNVRIEPVALGGIEGKGLWLDGDIEDGLTFDIYEQPQDPLATPWYVGIFLDPRFGDRDQSVDRTLFRFPDNSRIILRGRSRIAYVDSWGNVTHTIDLPLSSLATHAFTHLAFITRAAGTEVDFLLNGYRYDSYSGSPLFRMIRGHFHVGAVPNQRLGVRGWIDELRVLARDPGLEVACNLARGTLIELNASSDPDWYNWAGRFPKASHQNVAQALGATGNSRYVCFHDYEQPLRANLGNLPTSTVSIRDELLFPEGPLVHNQPRPDSSTNTFCRSCHVRGQPIQLAPISLFPAPSGQTMHNDPRRQPMQPPRLIFGHIPAGFLDGKPTQPTNAPMEGFNFDKWFYP